MGGWLAGQAASSAWFSYRPSKLLIGDQILLTVIRIPAGYSCEAADFVIDCAAKLPAQLIITGGGWQSRCGGSEVAQAAARGATGDCQDMPSNASRMSCYTGATSTTYATTSLRAGQGAGGGEGLVA